MLIEVGHENAFDGKVITQTRLSDDTHENGEYLVSYTVGADAATVKAHLFENPGLVTHMGGNTAILEVVNPIRERVQGPIEWVAVHPEARLPEVAADFERFLSEFWTCSAGKPADVEETHWTLHGGQVFPPGEAPEEGE